MTQLLKMAFRDLGRNKRRSILSALAVALGMTLLLFMAATIRGEMRGALQNSVRLQTGHIQVRAASYDESKASVAWKDMIAEPDQLVTQIETLPQVSAATPRLFASGILSQGEQSKGVQVVGLEPDAELNQVYRQGMLSGDFLTADDREGILVGKPLADKFHLQAGQQVNLLVNTSDGGVDQQVFTIRGIYSTNTYVYDESRIFMPLAKAQALTGTENHATTIFVMLKDQDQAEAVAAALSSPDYQVKTWKQMNEFVTQYEDLANSFMVIFYLIVLGITATVVTNTLVMSVYERTREIGILAAIGMKGRRIMSTFLTEAGLLATGGVLAGLIMGIVISLVVARIGLVIPVTQAVTGMLFQDRIRPSLVASDAVTLTIVAYAITLLASLYPAGLAARMEPVEALHAQ
jgi:ABC-type lipoprotein release transport system permease subunit